MKNKGFAWHCHHNRLLEWCYDYKDRIREIEITKPTHEIKTRLKLFKFVKGKLPKELVEAGRECDKAWQEYHNDNLGCIRIWRKHIEILPKYRNYLEALHQKECGCKEWNGKKIIFKKVK